MKQVLQTVNSIRDLGVTFDSYLHFSENINDKINKANIILGSIKEIFVFYLKNQ
jgi:hypothetical protein